MLASLKAAGLGVTLTAADYVFLMDPWWNPAAEEQAIDRAHRIGRKNPYSFIVLLRRELLKRKSLLQKKRKKSLKIFWKTMVKGTRCLIILQAWKIVELES